MDRRSWPARPRVRRRQTLPSLPATPTDEEEQTKPQQPQPRDSWKKHSRVPSSSATASEQNDASQTTGARSRRLGARLSGDGQTTISLASTSASAFVDTRGPHRRLGRTPSSPSVLLSKVKERIREKVSIDTQPRGCNDFLSMAHFTILTFFILPMFIFFKYCQSSTDVETFNEKHFRKKQQRNNIIVFESINRKPLLVTVNNLLPGFYLYTY